MLKPYKRAELTFTYQKEIGQSGRNSRTYVAQDQQLNAEIIVKELTKSNLDANLFFAESQALYASAHPNVVQIHYSCEDADNIFVAMPYYKNGSLKDAMLKQHLTVREIIKYGCQVLSGLHNVHSKSLVHFDIKPDNVLLSDRNEALISDFGLARPMNSHGIAVADQAYVLMQPPEAFHTQSFSRAFDVYQFGAMLYRMCNGNDVLHRQLQKFVQGGSFDRLGFQRAVETGSFPDRQTFLPHIPERLRKAVRACLGTDAAQRPTTAIEVANMLAPIDGATLDWRYARHSDRQTWEKNIEGTNTLFVWADAGNTMCYRHKDAGTPRRHARGCTSGMTDRQVRSFLGDT